MSLKGTKHHSSPGEASLGLPESCWLSLFDRSPQATLVLRHDRIAAANEAAVRLLGFSSASLMGALFSDYILTDVDPSSLSDQQAVSIHTQQGPTLASLTISTLYDDRDDIAVAYLEPHHGIGRDRRQHFGHLRAEEYESLMDAIPVGIGIAEDSECRAIRTNGALARMLGVTPGQNASKTALGGEQLPFQIYHQGIEVASSDLPMQVSAREGCEVRDVEIDIKRADGSIVKLLSYITPLFSETGEPRGSLGAFIDITDRWQAETALKLSRDRMDLVLSSIGLGLWYCDLPFDKLVWNDRCKAHFGLPPTADVTIHTFYERIHPEDRERTREAIDRALEHRTGYDIIYRTVDEKGTVRWIRAIGESFYNEEGQPVRFDGVTLDVSEQKRTEFALRESRERLQKTIRELQRSNDDLNQFAHAASHDLQEPLRMVASFSQLLQRRYHGRLDPDADEYIQYIVYGAQRMSALLRDLLAYTQTTLATEQPTRSIPCEQILEEVKANLQLMIAQTEATIEASSLPELRVHRVQLVQLLQNILENAMKYRGDERPRVKVTATKEEGYHHFTITDNGIGIDPAHRDKIFGIFKRLHGYKYPGTGIGLAICQRVVERYGGKIWVESELGQGSTFHFTLPG